MRRIHFCSSFVKQYITGAVASLDATGDALKGGREVSGVGIDIALYDL